MPDPTTRATQITDRLRDDVLQRHFAPGQKLIELELAARYKASRTPVRAALSQLASEGLLTYRPQQGYLVRGFTVRSITEASMVRGRLEAMAAEAAASRPLSSAADARFHKLLATGDAILAKGRLTTAAQSTWQDMNQAFHDLIIAEAGNAFLAEMIEKARRVPFLSVRNIHWYDLERDYAIVKRSHALHHRIHEAIARGDPRRAAALMERHIQEAIPHLVQSVVDQRVIGDHAI